MKSSIRDSNPWMYGSLIVSMIIFLAGCGAGKTMVYKPVDTAVRFASVEVSEVGSTVTVPDDAKVMFREKLAQFLYEEGGFQKGRELEIRYRFIQFNPGSQFTRWFWGGLGSAGEGTLTVEAKYFDGAQKELAVIQSEGKIGSGAFGGSFNFAVEKCAKEIAEYTKKNFK